MMESVIMDVPREYWSKGGAIDKNPDSLRESEELPLSKSMEVMHNSLLKLKEEKEGLELRRVRIRTPHGPLSRNNEMKAYVKSFFLLCSRVFGPSVSDIREGKDELLHFIFEFREPLERPAGKNESIYVVMAGDTVKREWPVVAFLNLEDAQEYMLEGRWDGWPEEFRGLSIFEMLPVSADSRKFAWSEGLHPDLRKSKADYPYPVQGAITLLEMET